MVQAQSLTATLVYTYNADGLRVAQSQSVSSVQSVDTFTWDWATPVPELLSDGDSLYLIGYDTLGWQRGDGWTFVLPDALGSVRQETDAAGAVMAVREWSPYGEEIGGAQTGLGYTGEWWDAVVGLVYLRARWYDGTTGRFTQKDLLDQASFYLYARNNPMLYIDPSGFLSLKPGYIENAVGGISLFTFAGQLDWLRAAVHNVPELWQLYTYTKDEIDSNRFSSGTLRDLYEYTFSEARKLFDDSFECVHFPDLEYAHAALIVLAYIPANHDEDGRTWDKYPLFMPDGRPHEPGWDKAGHFFLNAFTAFEGKYSSEYTRNRELIDIARMGSQMGGIIGWNNISAIEADYLANTDAPYWGSEGLTGDDAALFNSLITIGNGYELLTSLNHLPDSLLGDSKIGSLIRDHGNTEKSNIQPKDLIILMALDRICNGGRNIDILVETLLRQVRDPARNEGLLDSGVYRDQVANRLGVHFGIQVFNNPAIVPAIPYDVGISGFRQIQVGGQSAYIYDFP